MVSKENEEMFLIIITLVGAFVIYKIFTMCWKGSTIEGLQNQASKETNSGLAEKSTSNLATFNKQFEALENKVLLTTRQYNTNYSDKCSAAYNAVNYLMVQTVANMDISTDTNSLPFLDQLIQLNALYQAKIALNDTLKFIDSTETTDSTK